jgi:hypothetical protein
MEGSGIRSGFVQIMTDPGGPTTYGSSGFGFTTLELSLSKKKLLMKFCIRGFVDRNTAQILGVIFTVVHFYGFALGVVVSNLHLAQFPRFSGCIANILHTLPFGIHTYYFKGTVRRNRSGRN